MPTTFKIRVNMPISRHDYLQKQLGKCAGIYVSQQYQTIPCTGLSCARFLVVPVYESAGVSRAAKPKKLTIAD
jgi:hypothetical protein